MRVGHVTTVLAHMILWQGLAVGKPLLGQQNSAFRSLPSAYWLLQVNGATLGRETKVSPKLPAEAIDINAASAEDFKTLPGIGPELARRIVTYREKHGPFRRVEDLLAIRGIGHKKWKAIRPYLRVSTRAGRK